MLFTIYGIALLAGGVLVALSAFAGGHDLDAGHDLALDAPDAPDVSAIHVDGDLAGGHDLTAEADIGHTDISTTDVASGMVTAGNSAPRWRPFKEMRFWTFFAAFFGLSGVLFQLFGTFTLLPLEIVTAVLLGSGSGFMASYVMYAMTRRESNSMASISDYNGATGKVLLPVGAEEQGKVRLTVRGQIVDLPALTAGKEELVRGDAVLVIGYDIKARVAKVTKLPHI